MRRSRVVLPLLLIGVLTACQSTPAPRSVAAQILSFNTRVATLQTAVQAELSGQPSTLSGESRMRLGALRSWLGNLPGPLRVAEAAQLVTPSQVQTVTPDLRGVLVLSIPADTPTTWAATVTVDVKAGTVLTSVANTDLTQPYHPARVSYAAQQGGAPLLRFVAATPGVYPPRVSLGTLVATRLPASSLLAVQATPPASDTATVAEYSPTGTLLSVR